MRATMAAGSVHATGLTMTLRGELGKVRGISNHKTKKYFHDYSFNHIIGPAPLNLEVPPYVFMDDSKVLVGKATLD